MADQKQGGGKQSHSRAYHATGDDDPKPNEDQSGGQEHQVGNPGLPPEQLEERPEYQLRARRNDLEEITVHDLAAEHTGCIVKQDKGVVAQQEWNVRWNKEGEVEVNEGAGENKEEAARGAVGLDHVHRIQFAG